MASNTFYTDGKGLPLYLWGPISHKPSASNKKGPLTAALGKELARVATIVETTLAEEGKKNKGKKKKPVLTMTLEEEIAELRGMHKEARKQRRRARTLWMKHLALEAAEKEVKSSAKKKTKPKAQG